MMIKDLDDCCGSISAVPKTTTSTRSRGDTGNKDLEESMPDKDRVLKDLVEMGYSVNRFGNYEIKDEETGTRLDVKEEILTTRIYNHRQLTGKKVIRKERIRDILIEDAQTYCEHRYYQKVKENTFVPGTPNKIELVCAAIAGTNYHRLYPAILNHLGHSIKRRMLGMKAIYPLLVNFSGPEECGKSYLVRQMLTAILPDGYVEELKDCGDVLGNLAKNAYLFTERLGVVLGELTNMGAVSIESLKDLIDAEEVHYRKYFTQSSAKGPNRAQLIGTSNKHLRDIFQRDEYIRKYCNIAFDECPRVERINKRWPVLDAFDWNEWMRSIDENAPSPLEAVYAEFKEWVKKDCYKPTETEIWVSGFIHRNAGSQKQFLAIYDFYLRDPHIPRKAQMGRDNFQKLLVKMGCAKKVLQGRSHYILPLDASPLDGWDLYFASETASNPPISSIWQEEEEE